MKLLIILLFSSNIAFTKGRDGNGGNEIAMRFTQIATDSLKFLKKPGNNSKKINLQKLENAIKDTKVYVVTYKLCDDSKDKTCPGESGYVAKNYPLQDEIYINEVRWRKLSFEEKVRITIHEYLGIIGVEAGNYSISSNIIIGLNATEGRNYSCQMSLVELNKTTPVLGTAGFVVSNFNISGGLKSFPIKYSKDDVVFRIVTGKNYLRAQIEIARVNRKNKHFVEIKELKEIVFPEMIFFEGEPIGVKVFKNQKYHLQVACSHI